MTDERNNTQRNYSLCAIGRERLPLDAENCSEHGCGTVSPTHFLNKSGQRTEHQGPAGRPMDDPVRDRRTF